MAYMRYYRSTLNSKEQKAYDILVDGIARRRDNISVPKITEKELERVHAAVNYDYPDFFYVDFYSYRYIIGIFHTQIEIKYTMSASEAIKIKAAIDQKSKSIALGAKGLSELETERYLNDEIRKIAVYDRVVGKEFNAQSIIGTFLDGKCVCEGFAKAFKYLADMLQLKSIIVVGESSARTGELERHAWNMVRVDGESYHLDVTYNNVEYDGQGNIKYFSRAYFNLSDYEICRDHIIDTMFKVPACPKSRSEIAIVSSTRDLIAHLKSEEKKKTDFTEIRITKRFEIDEIISLIRSRITPLDYFWYNRIDKYHLGDYSLLIEWVH